MTNPLNKDVDIHSSQEDRLNEALFGLDEEIDTETADDILASYGISSEELVADFKLLIQQEVRENYGNVEKKKEFENQLRVLKDILNYMRASDPELIEPKTLIQGFLKGEIQPRAKPSFAFRNKGKEGISSKDKQILDELEKELDEE